MEPFLGFGIALDSIGSYFTTNINDKLMKYVQVTLLFLSDLGRIYLGNQFSQHKIF